MGLEYSLEEISCIWKINFQKFYGTLTLQASPLGPWKNKLLNTFKNLKEDVKGMSLLQAQLFFAHNKPLTENLVATSILEHKFQCIISSIQACMLINLFVYLLKMRGIKRYLVYKIWTWLLISAMRVENQIHLKNNMNGGSQGMLKAISCIRDIYFS